VRGRPADLADIFVLASTTCTRSTPNLLVACGCVRMLQATRVQSSVLTVSDRGCCWAWIQDFNSTQIT
jgi:hypothetical protein